VLPEVYADVQFGQSAYGGVECLAVVVDLGVVVEYDQPLRGVCGQCQFDGIGEVIHAGEDRHRLGLDQDRMQLLHGRTRLQRNGDRASQGQGHVDDGVIGAGEPESRDAVAGLNGVASKSVGEGADPLPRFAVGQGVEAGLQGGDRSAGVVGDELDRSLTKRRSVGVAGHRGADHVGELHSGTVQSGGDRWVGLGGNQLRVAGTRAGGQLVEATG
jgi:hypothetical protein